MILGYVGTTTCLPAVSCKKNGKKRKIIWVHLLTYLIGLFFIVQAADILILSLSLPPQIVKKLQLQGRERECVPKAKREEEEEEERKPN